jgi:hypothetical protein
MHLYQAKGKKLEGRVREESLTGKAHFFERLAKEAAVVKTSRHADTVVLDPIHSRRMVVPKDYVWSALVDQQDKIRLLIDPASEYAVAAANALQRAWLQAVIDAFDADAKGGEDGSTAVTFASEAAGDETFGTTATTANVLKLKKDLDLKDVPLEDRYLICRPAFITSLLANATAPIASSSDYNTIKALVMGELNTWVGFEWTMSTQMNVSSGVIYKNFVWHKDAMGVAVNKDINARLSERADKDYAIQAYSCMTMGATRIQGEGVVRFTFDET